MRLVNAKYGMDIEMRENEISVLVIENPDAMFDIISMLHRQCGGTEGDFILSEKEKILKIDKKIMLITDIFSLQLNDKKVINRLYALMEEISGEYVAEKQMINQYIINALDKVAESLSYNEVTYDLELDWNALFKIYNVRIAEEYSTLCEKLIEYIKIVADFGMAEVLALVNLKTLLPERDLEQLYEMAGYKKVQLLLIEAYDRKKLHGERKYIIDPDRCWLDLEGN